MTSYLGRRLLAGVFTILVSSLIVFSVVRVIPGDPLTAALGAQDSFPEAAKSLEKLYGLDRPLPQQYMNWISAVMTGDLGVSLISRSPVSNQIWERIPRTLYLLAGGLGTGILISVPVAIAAARRPGSPLDGILTSVTTLTLATPAFLLGLVLTFLFSVRLGWLPAVGFIPPSQSLSGFLRTVTLPWLTIGLVSAASIARVLRSSLLDVLGRDFIRTARARGLKENTIMRKHTLRNASIPAVTLVGLQAGYLLGGAIIIEVLFSYPGMGLLIIKAITQRDYPMIQAALLFFATGFVVVNFLTDILYRILDPRLARP